MRFLGQLGSFCLHKTLTVGATAEDVRGAHRWGFQNQDAHLLSHSCCDSRGWEQGANVYKLGGRPWRTQDNIELLEWVSRGCTISSPGTKFAGKTQELTSAEHRGGLYFPFDLTVVFHFCALNSVLKTHHIFSFSGHPVQSWGVTRAWGWQPAATIPTEVVDWHRGSVQAGERHLCFWSCLSHPQPAEVCSTGACAARVGEELWQRWIKPPAKNRQAKGLEQPPGHTPAQRGSQPELRSCLGWEENWDLFGHVIPKSIFSQLRACDVSLGSAWWGQWLAQNRSSTRLQSLTSLRTGIYELVPTTHGSRFPLQAGKFLP